MLELWSFRNRPFWQLLLWDGILCTERGEKNHNRAWLRNTYERIVFIVTQEIVASMAKQILRPNVPTCKAALHIKYQEVTKNTCYAYVQSTAYAKYILLRTNESVRALSMYISSWILLKNSVIGASLTLSSCASKSLFQFSPNHLSVVHAFRGGPRHSNHRGWVTRKLSYLDEFYRCRCEAPLSHYRGSAPSPNKTSIMYNSHKNL